MTMRTYEYFACADGHQGEEKTIERVIWTLKDLPKS
jgi:hypothetical protein